MSANFFDLSGKVAVVTGASRGLGQYFGRALAKAGADLVITSRDVESLIEFKAEIESLGRRAVVFLASDASEYITGQTLLVDGGISVGTTRALPKK